MSSPRPGPLSDLRIIEMAGIGPAPFTAMLLADLGAQVLRVTRPGQVDPLGLDTRFNTLWRSRDSVELDLRTEPHRDALWRLIARADGLIEGFRPGVMERLGFGPDAVLMRQPSLVYGRVTGWGQDGPRAREAGHDLNYLAVTGAVSCFGPPDGPPVPPLNLVADFGGGGMYLAFGLLAALMERQRTGRGQVVDAAMVDGTALMMGMTLGMQAAGALDGGRGRTLLDGGAPFYRCYAAADGRHLTFCPIEPRFWAQALDRLGLTDDPDFAAQQDQSRWPAMSRRLEAIFSAEPLEHWERLFAGSDACFAPVVALDDIASEPHNAARQSYVTVDGVAHPVPGPRFSNHGELRPGGIPQAPIPLEDALSAWKA